MDMGREGKLERLAEYKESRLIQKLEECAIRFMSESFFLFLQFLISLVGCEDPLWTWTSIETAHKVF